MKTRSMIAGLLAVALLMAACGREQPAAEVEAAPAAAPYVVEIKAVGKRFQMPREIPSGWITFRFVNASSMLHFAWVDVPPIGIPIEEISQHVMMPFQEALDAMNANDEEGVNAAFGKFPAWMGNLGHYGGPGFLSPGRVGETTVYLEPGRYLFECYIKSDGIFHTTPTAPGEIGMLIEFNVTEKPSGAPEPTANANLLVTNAGFVLTGGEITAGKNTFRVDFVEQQSLPTFVGNDIHVMRVDGPERIAAVDAWMDWRTPDGLETPAPVEFLGGINDMPAGERGYFTVDLEPGDYAFIAEVPGPVAAGFVLPFSVP